MLGIVIGISSVIAMVAIGQGAQQSIQTSIQSIGSNLLTVSPGAAGGVGFRGINQGAGSAQTLVSADADAIATIASVKVIAPEVSARYQVKAKGENTNTSVVGTTPEYSQVRNIAVELGTFLTEQNRKGLSKVAVIGPDTRDELFGEGVDPIGQKLRIQNLDFTVIGVTQSKGGTGFGSSDDMVLVPLNVAQQFFTGDDHLSSISVQVAEQALMEQTEQEITAVMLAQHNIASVELADFRVFNQADIVNTASSVTQTFTLLLGAVAGISLVVGGIGIMNMMLTTVTERTREIGLRKSLGATKADIAAQFLAEAVLLTFLGGILGVLIGWLVTLGISAMSGIATRVNLAPVLLAFGVSVTIGIVFGYYPARQASRLNPIEALRYE